MIVFILLILNWHFINDFIIQSDSVVKRKKRFSLKSHVYHSIFASLPILIAYFFFPLPFNKIKYFIFLIFLSHIAIDYLKCFFEKITKHPICNFIIFIIDQFLHILFIINLSQFFFKNNLVINNLETIKYLILFATFIFITFIASTLINYCYSIIYYPHKNYSKDIKKVLEAHLNDENEKTIIKNFDSLKIGKFIGIFERTIIFLSVLMIGFKDSTTIIVGLLTLKSITRFKSMDTKIFSEYYLIGTSLSYLIVLIPFFISFLTKNEIQFIINLMNSLIFI